MIYEYSFDYDEEKDDFLGMVYNPMTERSDTVFSIDTVEEMCSYIKTGVMKHIDDAQGLEAHLKAQNFIDKNDIVVLCKEAISG